MVQLKNGEPIATFWILHVGLSSLFADLLAYLNGNLSWAISFFSLTFGSVVALVITMKMSKNRERVPLQWFEVGLYLFILGILGWHAYQIFYVTDHFIVTKHPNNLGDLPLHLTYLRHMAEGGDFPLDNPFWAGEKLRYPYGMDLYNALWEDLGVGTGAHLSLTILFSLMASLIQLHRLGGGLVVGALFLSGGLFGIYTLFDPSLKSAPAVFAWKNFSYSMFLTQRGLLWAIPAGAWVLRRVCIDGFHLQNFARQKVEFISLIGVFALLSFFHLHSFFILGLVFAAILVIDRAWSVVSLGSVGVALLASPFLLRSLLGFEGERAVHWKNHWMAGQEGALSFWWWNLGPWLFFMSVAVLLFFVKRDKRLARLGLACCLLFILFSHLMLAPWEWDNLKVLIWLYLVIVVVFSHLFFQRWKRSIQFIFLFVLVFPGGLLLLHESPARLSGVTLYELEELRQVEEILQHLDTKTENAVFAAAPTYNHPLSFFGQKLAMGYVGHIWSHGADPAPREVILQQIMTGQENWQKLAKQLNIRYIYWGKRERELYGAGPKAWSTHAERINTRSNKSQRMEETIEIYKLAR